MTTFDTAREPLVVTRRLRAAGWALHAYTASGTVLALLIVSAALAGDTVRALWLMLAAMIIDGTDGALARRLRVKETIPGFDGARLDDIVDYITYAFAPIVLLWSGGFLPPGTTGVVVASIPLLASCYQFCRSDAKTADHCFVGFPSYWNVLAFYVVILHLPPAATTAVLITCAVLVFVPIKYLYPSRTQTMRPLNVGLAGLWLISYAVILATGPHANMVLVMGSLGYLAYYFLASVYLTVKNPTLHAPSQG